MMLLRKQRDAILAEMYNASECPRSWCWEQVDCSLSYIALDAVVVMVAPCQMPDSESFALQVVFSRLQLLPQSSHATDAFTRPSSVQVSNLSAIRI